MFLPETGVETLLTINRKLVCAIILCVFSLLFFQGEEEVEMSSTELLYQGILPSLPQYMVGLLRWLMNVEFSQV